MRIHYLQHIPAETPGSILLWAGQRQYPVTYTKLYENEIFPPQKDFDWLIIMGGPMNIYEEDKFPWLISEKEFIKESIDNDKLVIGICLGGQLIAEVIGGSVVQNKHREIGWFPVTFSDQSLSMPQFSFLPINPVVFEWHGDTFIELPHEAVIIASNEACTNQAFVYKSRIYGFQFHMESTLKTITDLIEVCKDEMFPGKYVQSAGMILAEENNIVQVNKWMDSFLTKLSFLYEEGDI